MRLNFPPRDQVGKAQRVGCGMVLSENLKERKEKKWKVWRSYSILLSHRAVGLDPGHQDIKWVDFLFTVLLNLSFPHFC